jgi:hypothetical protein
MLSKRDNEMNFLIAKFFLNLMPIAAILLINLTEDIPAAGMAMGMDKWLGYYQGPCTSYAKYVVG